MRLKYYDKEELKYPLELRLHVTDKEATAIIRKLCLHFKLSKLKIKFWGYRNGATSYILQKRLVISHAPNFLLIAHEIAHFLDEKKYNGTGHNKKHAKSVKSIINYSKKKNYWSDTNKLKILKDNLSN